MSLLNNYNNMSEGKSLHTLLTCSIVYTVRILYTHIQYIVLLRTIIITNQFFGKIRLRQILSTKHMITVLRL